MAPAFVFCPWNHPWVLGSVDSLATTRSLSVLMTLVSTENKAGILAPILIHCQLNFDMGLVYPFGNQFMVFATLGLMALTWNVMRLIKPSRTQILVAAAD